jgi:hypothetical protein
MESVKPEELLDKIEDLSNLAKSSGKNGGSKTQKYIDSLLDVLDELIQLSADRFMSLDDDEEEESEQYIIHPNDIIKAKEFSSFLLLKLISTELIFNDDQDDTRIERASRLLAHMSGRGGKSEK